MQKFILKTVKIIKKNLKFVVIFFVIYFLGIVLGAIFSNKNLCNNALQVNLNNYYFLIFNVNVNVFKPFFNCVLSGILLTVAVSLFGFKRITTFLFSIIIFYRGLILGTCFVLFFKLSSISGVIVFFILSLPTNFIITAGLIICNVLNYDSISVCDFKLKVKKVFSHAGISIIFTLIASFYLIFLLITVIRPINLLF